MVPLFKATGKLIAPAFISRLLACGLILCALSTQALAQTQTDIIIEGIVLDQSGAPVVGAQVSLQSDSSASAQTITGADGSFLFNHVYAREGLLTIKASGFAQSQQKWSAKDAETMRLRIVLAPAIIKEEVTVTATRTETRLSDTALSVVLLSSADLQATSAVTLDDALRQIPGFTLFRRSGSRTANPTSQGVSLRGVGASGASRALVLADGIPLNDPFGGWVYWGRVPPDAIKQVEVLRGGASGLYGSGALGGVVQLITRRPTSPVLSFEASYGSERTPDASIFMGGRKGGWGASLAGQLFRTNGYILVNQRERGRIDTPANSRHAALDLTLDRQLTHEGRVFTRLSYFGESRSNGTPLQTNRTHLRQWSAGGDWSSNRAGAFSLRIYGGTQLFDQNFSAVAADRNSETLTRLQRVPSQVAGLMAQWSRPLGPQHTLVAGLEAREVRGASDELIFVQGRPNSLVGAGGRQNTFGLFLEDIFRPGPRLFITGGLRFDHWRNYDAFSSSRSTRQTGPVTTNEFADRAETAFSPQLSMLYKPGAKISFAASAYRAFRAPTLNELYRTFRVGDALTLANEKLQAERLTGGEAGTILDTFKHKLTARGTFFWTEITRPIANVTLTATPALITRQRQNLGRTRSRGLELEAETQLSNRWTITGGYLFSAARVISFPANSALEGLLIPQVPRHQLTFQVHYTNPSRFTFGLQGRFTGMQFDDDQNRFRLDRYFTLDALASHRLGRGLEIFAAAENLLNQRYQIGRTPVTTIGPPILLRAGIRLRLGSQ